MKLHTRGHFLTLLLFSSISIFSVTVFAGDKQVIEANVALSSDYVWRGYSQTNQDPAISGGFDYHHQSGFYAGVWGSNVGFAPDADLELDLYSGYAFDAKNGIGWDFGMIRYTYPGTTVSGNIDWNEYHVSATYGIATASINYSNDVYGLGVKGIYYTLGIEYGLVHDFTLAAGVGVYDYDSTIATSTVQDYHLGLSRDFEGIGFDLSYYSTNNRGKQLYGANISGNRVVLSVSKSF